jgi:hypothetical protein
VIIAKAYSVDDEVEINLLLIEAAPKVTQNLLTFEACSVLSVGEQPHTLNILRPFVLFY